MQMMTNTVPRRIREVPSAQPRWRNCLVRTRLSMTRRLASAQAVVADLPGRRGLAFHREGDETGATLSRGAAFAAITPRTETTACCNDAWIDRGGRRPSEGGVRGIPGPSPGGLDPAAVAALSEPAARPDRGADLRPRMAARLRQAAAAAVVAGRGRLPGVRHRRRLLRAGAGRGGRRLLRWSGRRRCRWSARAARSSRC